MAANQPLTGYLRVNRKYWLWVDLQPDNNDIISLKAVLVFQFNSLQAFSAKLYRSCSSNMTTAIFGSMLDVESGVPTPKPAYYSNSKSRDYGLPSPTPLKLDELQWNAVYTGPATPEATAETRTPAIQGDEDQTTTPGDRFGFQPSQEHLASEALQSWSQGANKWRVLSACVVYFNNGLSDSAPGALLPYMEDHYHISYSIVSLVFVAQALGFLTAAFFNEMIKNKIGYAKTYALSEFLLVVAYAIIVATPPYPVVVFTYFLVGLAASANNALSNVFCANLASSTVVLGAAQGAYGLGGTIGPIIATLIVSRGAIWSKYYFLTLGTCMFGGIVSFWSFRGFENERSNQLMSALERQAASQATSKRTLLAQALRYSVTIIGALFTFAYQGAEVSISGWVISFLITERQGDPGKVGYVSAGFW